MHLTTYIPLQQRSHSILKQPFQKLTNILFVMVIVVASTFYFFPSHAQAIHANDSLPDENESSANVNETIPESQLYEDYEGVFIEINKDSNRLNVYLNNHIIYTFDVATGRQAEDTPEGQFQIVNKVKEPWYLPKDIPGGSTENPLGTRWLGLNVPDTNGYKYGIHGTNNASSIGMYASDGCIRMHNKDVEWLFRHIPVGTIVIIK